MVISRTITLLILLLITVISLFAQMHTLLNMDVSMLMHVSERMLKGGTYGVDIFESNPPMILYIYAIPVLAAKWTSTNFIITCRIFIYLLIALSLFLSYRIIKKMPDIYKITLLLPATAGILLLPGIYFAQKEHIMLILIMPYVYYSIANGITMRSVFVLAVTLMAGIGFCIKPHFFIPFFMFLIYKRNITIDNIIIVSIAILYFLAIVIFYPTYFTTILPLVSDYYYPYFDANGAWSNVGLHFSLFILMIYGFSFYFIKNHELENGLAIYAIGFIVVYLLQKSNWGYHIYPAIAFVMLLVIQMVYRYLQIAGRFFFVMTLMSFCLLIEPLKYYYLINKTKQPDLTVIEHLSRLKNINSVYFLSNNPSPYPAVDYLNLKDIQRIQCYWFLPGMNKIKNSKSQIDLEKYRNIIVNDIILKKPDVLVVSSRLFPHTSPDFSLHFFLKNQLFKYFLSQYKPVANYEEVMIFEKSGFKIGQF